MSAILSKIWHTCFLEPVNTLTHLIAAIGALGATAAFLLFTTDNRAKLITLLVFGLSMAFLFFASAMLHGLRLPSKYRVWLNRLDHAAIFLAIAGTYTPIVYHFLPKDWRWLILLPVWSVALIGIAFKLLSKRIHGFLNVAIYLIVSWGGAVLTVLVADAASLMPWPAFRLLLLGGIIYTVGFVVYYYERPDPWPNRFGHHEIWHLFVMGGSFCHFLFMFWYVA